MSKPAPRLNRSNARRGAGTTPRALAIAVAIHIALFVTLALAPHRRPSPVAAARVDAADAELAIVTEGVDREAEPTPAPSPAHQAAVAPSTRLLEAKTRELERPSAAPPSAAVSDARSTVASLTITRAATPDIGLALGSNVLAAQASAPSAVLLGAATLPDRGLSPFGSPFGARPPAPSAEEAKRNVEASLNAPARARDRALGLGPEGPVLSALREATYASTAPVEGSAVFVAVADGSGAVENVALVACNGDRAGWESAATLARAALTGQRLRVAGALTNALAKRTVMKIQLVSALKMPSGHDAGVDATLLGVPVSKGEGKRSTKVAVLDPVPRSEVVEVEILPGLKMKISVVEWDVLAIHGDPVDIGAKARRVVQTKLIETVIL